MSEGLLRSTISYNEVNTEQSCFKNSTQKIDDISEQRYISQNNSCVREALSATVKILLNERCFISSQPRPNQQDTSSNNHEDKIWKTEQPSGTVGPAVSNHCKRSGCFLFVHLSTFLNHFWLSLHFFPVTAYDDHFIVPKKNCSRWFTLHLSFFSQVT